MIKVGDIVMLLMGVDANRVGYVWDTDGELYFKLRFFDKKPQDYIWGTEETRRAIKVRNFWKKL